MPDQDLRLHVGDVLQLQPVAGGNKRYGAKLLGYNIDKSLIITAPRVSGKPLIVRDGQMFVVRILTEELVHGFQCSVLTSYNKPYPHLHLSYPRETKSVVIRKAQRVKLALPAQVANISMKSYGESICHIVDLSTSGARLKAMQQIGAANQKIKIEVTLSLADENEHVVIEGLIRNVDVMEDEYYFGVEFKPLARKEVLIIHGFVLEQVVNSRG